MRLGSHIAHFEYFEDRQGAMALLFGCCMLHDLESRGHGSNADVFNNGISNFILNSNLLRKPPCGTGDT